MGSLSNFLIDSAINDLIDELTPRVWHLYSTSRERFISPDYELRESDLLSAGTRERKLKWLLCGYGDEYSLQLVNFSVNARSFKAPPSTEKIFHCWNLIIILLKIYTHIKKHAITNTSGSETGEAVNLCWMYKIQQRGKMKTFYSFPRALISLSE